MFLSNLCGHAGLQVLECKALAGNVGFLGSLLEHSACPEPSPGPLPRGPAVAQAVCIMDRPLQEGETQVRWTFFSPVLKEGLAVGFSTSLE